jgi:hypothetical protein
MWVVSFTPYPLYPGEKAPGTHSIEGWVGSRAGLDALEKKKNPIIACARNPCRPARSLVSTYWATSNCN